MADEDRKNRGQGGQRNDQSQKKPQGLQCKMCGEQNLPMGAGNCNQCGQPLKIECPECSVLVINTKRCSNCGADLHPAKPATPIKSKPPVYELFVKDNGRAGVYTLEIQVLKDGEPSKDQDIVVWDGESHTLTTDAKGFVSHRVNFTCNELHATVTVTGTNKSWTKKLVGASFRPAGGFLKSLFDAIDYYRSK